MQMTNEEIYARWRKTNNPKTESLILAELNQCSVEHILEIVEHVEVKRKYEQLDAIDRDIKKLEDRYRIIASSILG